MSDNKPPNLLLIAFAAAAVGVIAARVVSKALQEVEARAQKAERDINRRIDNAERQLSKATTFICIMMCLQFLVMVIFFFK